MNGLDIDAYLAWMKEAKAGDLEAVERLLAQASAFKRERSVEWRIKGSGLKDRKIMASFAWDFQPKLDRRAVESQFTLAFAERHEDLLITGKQARATSSRRSPSRPARRNGWSATLAAST